MSRKEEVVVLDQGVVEKFDAIFGSELAKLPPRSETDQVFQKISEYLKSNGVDLEQEDPGYNNFFWIIDSWTRYLAGEITEAMLLKRQGEGMATTNMSLIYLNKIWQNKALWQMWTKFWQDNPEFSEMVKNFVHFYSQFNPIRRLWTKNLLRYQNDVDNDADHYLNERSNFLECDFLRSHIETYVVRQLENMGIAEICPDYRQLLRM